MADITRLPVSINATFVDEASGQRTDMGLTRLYRYTSDGKARTFRIEASPRPVGILTLTTSQLTGSSSVDINATFGVAGRATLDIEKTGGDLIRNIAAENVVAGARKWTWSGTNSAGAKMPAGSYVARLHFRDDRGVETEKSVSFALK